MDNTQYSSNLLNATRESRPPPQLMKIGNIGLSSADVKSPLRQGAALILSPKEMATAIAAPKDDSHVQGYQAPTTLFREDSKDKFSFSKKASVCIIVEEAKKKMLLPGPGQYKVKPATPWSGGTFVPGAFTRRERHTPADEITIRSKRADLTTPGPTHYRPNYKHVESRPTSGYSSMQM